MTLLELTVVILVLLTLISVLFFGAKAWKRGSDRATCIIQLSSVQKGLRSYANLNGFSPGDAATNLKNQIIGFGKFIQVEPKCPALGSYTFGQTFGADTIPPMGELYMQCSLATADSHEPTDHAEW
jgi:type II secretory pathway pseudopilin PulG